MRFPKSWKRQKGGASTDPALDTTAPTTTPPNTTTDNVMSCKFWSINGWPVQRICACWSTTAAAPIALNGSLYVWIEDLVINGQSTNGHWFLVNDTALAMKPNELYYFDVPAILEPSPLNSNIANGSSAGSLDCMLLMQDPGAQVNGVFTIAMAPDCSTIGT